MSNQTRIDELERFIEHLVDMYVNNELETTYEGETVKFGDAREIQYRINRLRDEVKRISHIMAGAPRRRVRGIQVRLAGDN